MLKLFTEAFSGSQPSGSRLRQTSDIPLRISTKHVTISIGTGIDKTIGRLIKDIIYIQRHIPAIGKIV